MKVLLTEDVKALGKKGEIKEVKDGYGNNFLIGKGLAKLATPGVMKQWEAAEKAKKEAAKAEIEQLTAAKKALEGVKLVIKTKTGANGSLFGSITKEEIAEELKKQHKIEIDKRSIEHHGAIKATGSYELDLKMGHGIHATLHLVVEAL
jgi:large subunit ribosomal protein L9